MKYEIPSGNLHHLESHLAIPFIQSDMRGPFWRPSLTNIEIQDPLGRSKTTWNPIWQFLLFEAEMMRSLLAISFNQKPENLSFKSVNLESPSGDSLLPIARCRSS